jgi:hypothetical protein
MARYGDDTNRDRWRDDDRERSSWRSGGQGTGEREDERGFFERASEEVFVLGSQPRPGTQWNVA